RALFRGLRPARSERAGDGPVRAGPGGRVRHWRNGKDGPRPGEHPRACSADPGTSRGPFTAGKGHKGYLAGPTAKEESATKTQRVLTIPSTTRGKGRYSRRDGGRNRFPRRKGSRQACREGQAA